MSGLTGILMGRMLSAYFRHPGSAALAAVAVIGLGASGWLGFGYLHYQRLVVAREDDRQTAQPPDDVRPAGAGGGSGGDSHGRQHRPRSSAAREGTVRPR